MFLDNKFIGLCTKKSIFSKLIPLVLGPATIESDGRDLLVGISSKVTRYPFFCGDPDDYSMYTSIYSFREWILKHVHRMENFGNSYYTLL